MGAAPAWPGPLTGLLTGPLTGPRLTQARAPLTEEHAVVDAAGRRRLLRIPRERALTLYVDKQELVTLMTLGQYPEWLVLGYLLNQRLASDIGQIESVSVDWDVGAAAVRSRGGAAAQPEALARRTVTSGCGQGTVFGDLLRAAESMPLLPAAASRLSTEELLGAMETVRALPSVHREAGSVHGTALLQGRSLLFHVEDVGRHNAVDTLAGWMALQGLYGAPGGDKLMLTTGRLTSEMVLKAAACGVPVVVSRNGITAMGLALARRLGMTLIGRASGRRFLCYCGEDRLLGRVPDAESDADS